MTQLNFGNTTNIKTEQKWKIGDCLELLLEIPNESVDLIVTDSPYGINYVSCHEDKNHPFNVPIPNDNNLDFLPPLINQSYRVLKNNSALYMFCNQNNVDIFKQELQKRFKIKNMIIWIKNNWTAGDLEAQLGKQYEIIFLCNKGRKKFCNDYRFTDVWNFDRISGDEQIHQNQKPLEIIKRCIEIHSNIGDLVCDPFLGSGTTLDACKILNRNFIGFEIDPKWESNYIKIMKQTTF